MDPKKGEDVKQSTAFETSARAAAAHLRDSDAGQHSLSGHEPNRFFINEQGKQFDDLSGLAGLDHTGDGRSVVQWDYDHDGWADLASINGNGPKLVSFRNQLGELLRDENRHFLAVRLVGGNQAEAPSSQYSSRDAIGTRLELEVNGKRLLIESHAGEGFSAQNSKTLLIGLGQADRIAALHVRWPSGIEQTHTDLQADKLLTLFENPAETGSPYQLSDYTKAAPAPPATVHPSEQFTLGVLSQLPPSKLRLFVLTATWCQACRKELPWLHELRKAFPQSDLALIGLPGDPAESAALLTDYSKKVRPPYALIPQLSPADRQAVDAVLDQAQHPKGALPATILTDGQGKVLFAQTHAPTLSQIRKALAGPQNERGQEATLH